MSIVAGGTHKILFYGAGTIKADGYHQPSAVRGSLGILRGFCGPTDCNSFLHTKTIG